MHGSDPPSSFKVRAIADLEDLVPELLAVQETPSPPDTR
jgi:hypothetical protein